MKNIVNDKEPSKEIASFITTECHHMEISEHNHLGLLSKVGIEIVSLNFSTTSKYTLCRYVLKVSTKYPLETFLRKPDNGFLWDLNFSSLQKISLLPESLGLFYRSQATPTIVDFKFSPTYHNICFLASVTSTGVLSIHIKICDMWKICYDLSDICLAESSKLWKDPVNESQWIAILEEGQIVRICWTMALNDLYILAAFKNGDIFVFSVSYDETFNTKCVTKIKGELNNPTSLYAFCVEKTLIIVQGHYSGIVRCKFLLIDSWELIRNEVLAVEEDYLKCHEILHISSETCVKIIVNKRHFLTVYNLSLTNSDISSKQIYMDQSILYSSLSNETLFIWLLDMTVVEFSTSTMSEKCRSSGESLSSLGVITSNNKYLKVVAIQQTQSDVQVLIYPSLSDDPRLLLRNHCETGGKLHHLLDLLWIYKVQVLMDIKSLVEDDCENSRWPKLRYWELMLLHNDQLIDEDTRLKVLQKLNEYEHDLISTTNSSYFENFSQTFKQPGYAEKCPVCGEPATVRNIAMLRCKQGHSIPRCCITMEPCSPIKFASCSNCPAKINLPPPDEMKLEQLSCPFCDGFFERNNLMLQLERCVLPITSSKLNVTPNQKLSKIETLRLACNYIHMLMLILGHDSTPDAALLTRGLSQLTSNLITIHNI